MQKYQLLFFPHSLDFFIAHVDSIGEKFALLEMTFKNLKKILNLEINNPPPPNSAVIY